MSKPQLEEEEYIIASDIASLHNELLSRQGTLYLTNARLLFFDDSSWRKSKNLSLFHHEIDMLEEEKLGFVIHTEAGIFEFRGTGSKRIYLRLHNRRQTLSINSMQQEVSGQELREVIYLQGDISLIENNFSTSAQLFFTSKGLRITTNSSLFRRSKTISCTIGDISAFQFTLRSRALTLQLLNVVRPIVFSGPLAPKLYLILTGQRDGGISYNWNNVEVGYTVGPLKIKGLLSITKKRIAFCPTVFVDTIAQAKEFEIPILSIHRIEKKGWTEKKLHIFFDEKSISFSTSSPEEDFPLFQQSLLHNPPKNPWKVQTRSELAEANARYNIKLKPHSEKILLVSWSIYKKQPDILCVGWLMLTNLQVRFLSTKEDQCWSAPVQHIHRTNDKNANICIQYKTSKWEFSCHGGERFTKSFWKRVQLLKPPDSLEGARSGQSIDKIIGSSPLALIFRKNNLIHQLSNVDVRKSVQKVTLYCDKVDYSNLKKNDLIEVEIPKIIGRFRFFAHVQNNHLNKQSITGGYEIELSRPDNIYVYNQRKSFRVPITKECVVTLHITETPDKHVLFEELPVDKEMTGTIFDISFGGCGIFITENIADLDPDQVLLRFSTSISKKELSLQGVLRHIAPESENGMWALGLQFVHLPSSVENTIFTEVLRLERDMLQKEKGASS